MSLEDYAKKPFELLFRGNAGSLDIVSYDVNSSAKQYARKREQALQRIIAGRDGKWAVHALQGFYNAHPVQSIKNRFDVFQDQIALPPICDIDGVLANTRGGYRDEQFLDPIIIEPITKIIETFGTFYMASACEHQRIVNALHRSKHQIPIERVVAFAENGNYAIIPRVIGQQVINGSVENVYCYDVYEKAMHGFINEANDVMNDIIDQIAQAALPEVWSANRNKKAKCTIEMPSYGKEGCQAIVDSIAVPVITSRLRLKGGEMNRDEHGSWTFSMHDIRPDFIMSINATKDSVEYVHAYLPQKENVRDIVRLIMNDLIYKNQIRTQNTVIHNGSIHLEYTPVISIGIGDSPFGSDFGITNPLSNRGYTNIPHGFSISSTNTLVNVIRKSVVEDIVSLPSFSEDGASVLGAPHSAAVMLDEIPEAGNIVKITDYDRYLDTVVTRLMQQGYCRTKTYTEDDLPQKNQTYPISPSVAAHLTPEQREAGWRRIVDEGLVENGVEVVKETAERVRKTLLQ